MLGAFESLSRKVYRRLEDLDTETLSFQEVGALAKLTLDGLETSHRLKQQFNLGDEDPIGLREALERKIAQAVRVGRYLECRARRPQHLVVEASCDSDSEAIPPKPPE
jgi:hypothetical protein